MNVERKRMIASYLVMGVFGVIVGCLAASIVPVVAGAVCFLCGIEMLSRRLNAQAKKKQP